MKTVAGVAARPHLFEIDLMRAVTAICVVGVHSTYFSLFLNSSPFGAQLQNGVVDALHFTRELFLTITAFVLVYTYAHRPLSFWTFWRKRGLGVLGPYLLWSLVYVWLGVPHDPFDAWLWAAGVAIVAGTASYQLYFILLSLEFYLVLPPFLSVVKRVGERHPWQLVIGSGVLQLAWLYLDHNYVQVGALADTPLGQFLNSYQYVLLPFYQFYAVLGAVAALHVDGLRSYVRRRGRWIVAGMILGLGTLWIRFGIAVWVQHQSDDYATTVFQPVLVIYSAAVALFIYWLGVIWATSRSPEPPRGQRFWSLLSDASFGIYLLHPLLLSPILSLVATELPATLPVAMRVAMIWGLTAGLTTSICVVLLYTPVLSRLMGRSSGVPGMGPWTRRSLAFPSSRGRGLPAR